VGVQVPPRAPVIKCHIINTFERHARINESFPAANVIHKMRILTIVAALFLPVGAVAEQAAPSLVLDASTGEVITAERAGETWYPASLTKMMTALVVFDKIREGKLKLEQQIPVSELANAQEPSKIGVPPGKTVSVDFALQALLVYSANDMAYVLAEAASGSVSAFSDDMNALSETMGLTATHFVNPNGLFDPRQVTSARDMGLIAVKLINEYPEYQRYFEQDYLKVGSRRFSNRNSLLRMMPEADGMKTGFVCNSGFNLVATASRNGRRLVAVVLGTRSGQARAKKAQSMLEAGFLSAVPQPVTKLAALPNALTPLEQIQDVTITVCPRKEPVLYANLEKFNGHAVALGFYKTAAEADQVLRDKLVEARGLELSGIPGVVQMPGRGQFAALVWGLDDDESEAYCEFAESDRSKCRVFGPSFLAELAVTKKSETPAPAVVQGSEDFRPRPKVSKTAKRKIKPARRVKRVLPKRRVK
jgi:D-alanyl-D-alanine carboxypeptidase